MLRPKERVLRSFNREKSYKDVSFSRIVRVEKPLLDRFRANIFLANRAHPIVLIFPDPIARERFVSQCNLIRLQIDEEEIAASTPPSAADAATTGVTTAGAVTATAAPRSANPPLSIFVGSWNLGNSPFAGEPLADFIPPMAYDLYCIGTCAFVESDAVRACVDRGLRIWLFLLIFFLSFSIDRFLFLLCLLVQACKSAARVTVTNGCWSCERTSRGRARAGRVAAARARARRAVSRTTWTTRSRRSLTHYLALSSCGRCECTRDRTHAHHAFVGHRAVPMWDQRLGFLHDCES